MRGPPVDLPSCVA
uniref:Uncharacterized protein n=1 Tax=Salix viminalis TaxID=40686 RepID=A0A6N2M2F4_SALVM